MNLYTPDGRDLRGELAPYLPPDEELLWMGTPTTDRVARPRPAVILFLCVWLGFAIFWTVSALTMGGLFGLFGLPFVIIGVMMFYQTVCAPKRQYRSAVYAVTDRRAIILYQSNRGMNCIQYLFANHPDVSMEQVQGNVGTIRFRFNEIYDEASFGRRRTTVQIDSDVRNTFAGIENVHSVYRMISERIA